MSRLSVFVRSLLGAPRIHSSAGDRYITRKDFFRAIRLTDTVLEIGPFTIPNVRGENVRYFEVLDKDALIARAKQVGFPHDAPVDIDYLSPTGDLSIVPDNSFDVVLSSHCIEHQPDLIAHLKHVGRILRPGGRYFIVVPDKRYCFDHFLAESSLADVLAAQGETLHSLKSFLDHNIKVTHNDAARHWRGDHGSPAFLGDPEAEARATEAFNSSRGKYIDVHAWQFTPDSFWNIIGELDRGKLISLSVENLYQTAPNTLEFSAVLRKHA